MIDFVGKRKIFFTLSSVLIALTIIGSFVFGVTLDIQFKGGAIITYSFNEEIPADEVEEIAQEALGMEVSVQNSEDIKTGRENVVISLTKSESLDSDAQEKLTQALTEKYEDKEIKVESISNVDPVAGQEFLIKCLVAVAFASLLMVIYIAFRFRKIGGWSAGVMAVAALVHDVLMVYAAFVFFKIPLNDNFIAVALTILGYSLNDTIVIYDRIRENKKLYGAKLSVRELVNKSINQSLTRSVNTSIATLAVMVCVCAFAIALNISSILSFALPMVFGIVSGVYSSVLLSGPLWVTWQEYKLKRKEAAKTASKPAKAK